MSRAQLTTADPPEIPMKNTLTLSITSLLSILFVSFHLTSDVLYAKAGSPEAGGSTLVVVPLMVVWLFGALVLAGRRSGYIVILVASLLGLMIPLVHVIGPVGIFSGNIVKPDGAFLFVWTLHSLAVTTLFSIVLSVQGLWSLRRAAQGSEESS